MELEVLLNFIGNNGFSIVVAMYSLTRLEKTVKENTELMREVLTNLRGGVSYE